MVESEGGGVVRAFPFEDSAQLCVLDVVEGHEGNFGGQVLIQPRARHAVFDFDVVPTASISLSQAMCWVVGRKYSTMVSR